MSQKGGKNRLVPLKNIYNPVESEMVQDLLRQEGIPVLVKDEASGGYLKIYAGYSVFGESLYVNEKDYDRARELLYAMQQNSEEALKQAQTDVFDDVTQYELHEREKAAQQPETRKNKSMIPQILIIAIAVILTLWKIGR